MHLSLATVAVGQPLLQLYGDNLAVFTTARFQGSVVVLFAVLVLLVPPVVVAVVDAGLTAVAARRVPRLAAAVHPSLVFIGLWACAASVFHSVSVGPWIVDALSTAAIGATALLGYLRVPPVKTWLGWLSPLAPAVLALFVVSASSLVWVPGTETVESDAGRPDSAVSVLWIQLDEAPLFPLVGTDGAVNAARFPGFARLAAASTWYRNAVTVSQHTAVAVPSMLSGLTPDYSRQPVAADHPRNVFSLVSSTMALDVVEEVTALCPRAECVAGSFPSGTDDASPEPVALARTGLGAFFRDAAIVLGHRLLPAGLRGSLPPIDEGWGNFGNDADGRAEDEAGSEDTVSETPDTAIPAGGNQPTRDKPRGHAGRTAAIQEMVARAAVAGDPAFRFIHVLLPHRPWVLAPDRRKSAKMSADPRPDTVPDRRRDNYQSHLNQYVAIDGVIGDMVDRLSASPAWENLMLIVTSDHGITFVPGQSYRDSVNPENAGTLDDIYRVPLFVKYPGQRTGRTDDCAASTLDLFATVESVVGLASGWTTDSVDLRTDCPVRRTHTVTWPEGTTTMTADVRDLDRRVAYYGRWVDPDGDVDALYRTGPAGALVGTRTPSDTGTDDRFEGSIDNQGEFTGVGSRPFEPVPTRAVGQIRARADIPEGVAVFVAVDGVIVGEVREAEGLRTGQSTTFFSSLVSRLIPPGSHEASLWSATPDGRGYLLRPIG